MSDKKIVEGQIIENLQELDSIIDMDTNKQRPFANKDSEINEFIKMSMEDKQNEV